MIVLRTIERWSRWEPKGLGPYETIRGRVMWRAVAWLALTVAVDAAVQLFLPGPIWISLIPLVFLGIFGIALRLLWVGRQQLATMLLVGWSLVYLSLAILPFGGIAGGIPVFVVTSAMMTVLWLERRAAAVGVALWVAMLVGSHLASRFVEVPPVMSGADLRLSLLICQVLGTTAIAALVGLTIDALHAASDEADVRALQATRAAAAARTASEAKARFLATMSHELRTPLNAIIGYTELLRDDAGPDSADLERIERSGHQLLALVEDVLELARADTTTGPARAELVDLLPLLDAQGRATGLEVELLLAGPPPVVLSDRAMLERIVANLLSHAVRVNRTGRIGLDLWVSAERIEVAVRDGGAPIPQAMLPRVFEPFVGGDRGQGTGLGLALAHRLAGRLGGGIAVTTSEDRGSTFTLHLPSGSS